MKQILLIEDDRTLNKGLCLALESEALHVCPCYDLKGGREALMHQKFSLILLDVNLPDGSGLELVEQLGKNPDLPIILLTANDTEMDVVTGLEMGADDYITKPFSLAVLRARVNNQLRKKTARVKKGLCYEAEGFKFEFDRMMFWKNNELLELSKTEQKLLRCLIENRGMTLSREQLVDLIWTDGVAYVEENALSVTIKRLRDKLEDVPSKPQYIKTIYGIGYTWVVK